MGCSAIRKQLQFSSLKTGKARQGGEIPGGGTGDGGFGKSGVSDTGNGRTKFEIQIQTMIDTKKIIAIAERELADSDLFVVGCTSSPAGEIELLLDSDTSVSIDACAALSRTIEAQLDREEEDFSLTVASAGIGSELRLLRQYRKLIGRSVEVLLLSGVKILAKLDAADEQGITLSYEEKQVVEGKKRKQPVTVTRTYPFTEIKYTKEYLDFK